MRGHVKRDLQAWQAVAAMAGLLLATRSGGSQNFPLLLNAPPNQFADYTAERPKTIVELQPFRQTSSIHIRSQSGKDGAATLINLNPAMNAWYLLKVDWAGAPEAEYHLENPDSRARKILLDEKYPLGVMVTEGNTRSACDLFAAGALDQGKASPLTYYPLCGGRILLRNPATGHRSTLEAATEFLRDYVWGGEKIIGVGHILLGDSNRETGELKSQPAAPAKPPDPLHGELPLPALVDPRYADSRLESANLGIHVESPARTGMTPGAWFAAADNPGIYVSLLKPELIEPALLQTNRSSVNALDGVEASALVYLVAFDLDSFDLKFALGTEHPRVGWSDRVTGNMRNTALPGPDGIGSISPLIATGLISPAEASRTVATFTGGFKREHGAFKYGELASENHGSHYGFIVNGVIFSKLQPGLATVFMLEDGTLGMKTWTEADNGLLARIRYARQNGVALIERDQATKTSVPGRLVNQWGAGNWSGSEDEHLRTMRAGAAFASNHGKRFLIYAVFSDATPSAMARIFEAYRCEYAMLLDMNALEHTYLAVYRRSGSQLFVDHLLKGMSVLEKSRDGETVPRFLGYADNRDFFYVTRR